MTLKPCRDCGAPCKIEPIANEHFTGNIWICSNSSRMGGTCEANIHLTRESWQDRHEDRMMAVDGDKFIEIIDQMTVMGDQINAAKTSLVRITMLLYDLIDQPHPAKLTEVAQRMDIAHGT